jgi:hypothetical protein
MEKEMAAIEVRKQDRWKQLIAENKWFDFESDK